MLTNSYPLNRYAANSIRDAQFSSSRHKNYLRLLKVLNISHATRKTADFKYTPEKTTTPVRGCIVSLKQLKCVPPVTQLHSSPKKITVM